MNKCEPIQWNVSWLPSRKQRKASLTSTRSARLWQKNAGKPRCSHHVTQSVIHVCSKQSSTAALLLSSKATSGLLILIPARMLNGCLLKVVAMLSIASQKTCNIGKLCRTAPSSNVKTRRRVKICAAKSLRLLFKGDAAKAQTRGGIDKYSSFKKR